MLAFWRNQKQRHKKQLNVYAELNSVQTIGSWQRIIRNDPKLKAAIIFQKKTIDLNEMIIHLGFFEYIHDILIQGLKCIADFNSQNNSDLPNLKATKAIMIQQKKQERKNEAGHTF